MTRLVCLLFLFSVSAHANCVDLAGTYRQHYSPSLPNRTLTPTFLAIRQHGCDSVEIQVSADRKPLHYFVTPHAYANPDEYDHGNPRVTASFEGMEKFVIQEYNPRGRKADRIEYSFETEKGHLKVENFLNGYLLLDLHYVRE